jgi:hypothetical protein
MPVEPHIKLGLYPCYTRTRHDMSLLNTLFYQRQPLEVSLTELTLISHSGRLLTL